MIISIEETPGLTLYARVVKAATFWDWVAETFGADSVDCQLALTEHTRASHDSRYEVETANAPPEGTLEIVDSATGDVLADEAIGAGGGATADQVLDEPVEGTITLRQAQRALLALVSKCSGGGTDTVTYRDPADTKDRIVYTVDAAGNRTAVTTDLT